MNDRLLLHINSWAGNNDFVDAVMIFTAKYLVFVVFASVAVAVGYLLYKRQWKQVAYFFGTLILSYVLLKIAGHIYVEDRPFVTHHLTQLISHDTGASFPSNHTTVTAALGFGLLFFTRLKAIGLSVLGCALLIGFARVFVGVHYPIDILGGLLVGLLGSSTVLIVKRLVDRLSKPTTS